MATPKKVKAAAKAGPVPEAPLDAFDPLAFINQNLQAVNYTEIDVQLEGFDGMFSLKLQGKNVHGAIINVALKFTRLEAPVAVFEAVQALSDASIYADHQEVSTPDFHP